MTRSADIFPHPPPLTCSTDMTSGLTEDKEALEKKMKEQVPLARISKPDEQAGMVVFLLSDAASCTSLP